MKAIETLRSVLRSEPVSHPIVDQEKFNRILLHLSAVHGVDALLHYRLETREKKSAWSEAVVDLLKEKVHALAVRELATKCELVSLLQRLAASKIDVLLLKGTPLAYELYPHPYLRMRGDTDMLIPEEQRRLTDQVLIEHGYSASEPDARDLGSYQLSYTRTDRMGIDHVVDLHWRLSNFQHYAGVFSFRELAEAAVPVVNLSSDARTLCPVHALMHACMHRAAHLTAPYFIDGVTCVEANRLIWLYDIHLLAESLSDDEWTQFSELTASKKLRAVCLDGLMLTEKAMGTRIPVEVTERLAAAGPPEPSARYLRPGRWRWKITELRALPTSRQRLALLTDWAFPPAGHMLKKYGVRNRWLLPLLYLRRVPGVFKLFRSPGKRE